MDSRKLKNVSTPIEKNGRKRQTQSLLTTVSPIENTSSVERKKRALSVSSSDARDSRPKLLSSTRVHAKKSRDVNSKMATNDEEIGSSSSTSSSSSTGRKRPLKNGKNTERREEDNILEDRGSDDDDWKTTTLKFENKWMVHQRKELTIQKKSLSSTQENPSMKNSKNVEKSTSKNVEKLNTKNVEKSNSKITIEKSAPTIDDEQLISALDFTRDVETTREPLAIGENIYPLEEPIFPGPWTYGHPESPKDRENATESVEATNRLNEDIEDRSDYDSDGYLRVRRDNIAKTYRPPSPDEIYIGTRVPRIVKPKIKYSSQFRRKPVIASPGSPPLPKLSDADYRRADRLWDEHRSKHPHLFEKNVCSRPAETGVKQPIKKRKFFKNVQKPVEIDVSLKESPVKKRRKKLKKTTKPSSPETATVCYRFPANIKSIEDLYDFSDNSNDREDIYENFDKSPPRLRKIIEPTRRSRIARDREDRLRSETIEKSDKFSNNEIRSRSRSSSTDHRQGRTSETAKEPSEKMIDEASGSKSASGNDRELKRSMRFADRIQRSNQREIVQSSDIREEAGTVEEGRPSKRTIDEASGSKSASGNDREFQRSMRFADRIQRSNQREIVRGSDVREEAGTAEIGRSKRKIDEASGSKCLSENDRSKKLSFLEPMKNLNPIATASREMMLRPDAMKKDLYDFSNEIVMQRDRKIGRSTIDKSPDLMAGTRARRKIVDSLTEETLPAESAKKTLPSDEDEERRQQTQSRSVSSEFSKCSSLDNNENSIADSFPKKRRGRKIARLETTSEDQEDQKDLEDLIETVITRLKKTQKLITTMVNRLKDGGKIEKKKYKHVTLHSDSDDSEEETPLAVRSDSSSGSEKIDRSPKTITMKNETESSSIKNIPAKSAMVTASKNRRHGSNELPSQSSADRDPRILATLLENKSSEESKRNKKRPILSDCDWTKVKESSTTSSASSSSAVPKIVSVVSYIGGRTNRIGKDRWNIDL